MSKELVFIFAALLLTAGPSSVFAQTDQSIVIVCPHSLGNGGSTQDTIALNLTAKTVAEEEWSQLADGHTAVGHHDGIITAISDQKIDWIDDQEKWAKNTLNRYTLDHDYVTDSTGTTFHESCHKQEKQL